MILHLRELYKGPSLYIPLQDKPGGPSHLQNALQGFGHGCLTVQLLPSHPHPFALPSERIPRALSISVLHLNLSLNLLPMKSNLTQIRHNLGLRVCGFFLPVMLLLTLKSVELLNTLFSICKSYTILLLVKEQILWPNKVHNGLNGGKFHGLH